MKSQNSVIITTIIATKHQILHVQQIQFYVIEFHLDIFDSFAWIIWISDLLQKILNVICL